MPRCKHPPCTKPAVHDGLTFDLCIDCRIARASGQQPVTISHGIIRLTCACGMVIEEKEGG